MEKRLEKSERERDIERATDREIEKKTERTRERENERKRERENERPTSWSQESRRNKTMYNKRVLKLFLQKLNSKKELKLEKKTKTLHFKW